MSGDNGDNVWILGTYMTKFGRHGDKDLIDLASESALGAMKDAEVTIHDMEVLGCGSLFNAMAGVGQQLQKQIGQTGIPVYNVANACATGATALRTVLLTIKAGEADMGLAVGVEQMGKGGLLGVAGKGDRGRKVYEPSGRYGSVMQVEGLLGTGLMPGVFAASRHGVRLRARRRRLRAVRQGRGEEPRALHAEPARSLPEAVHARRGHGRRDDELPEHVAHVLPEHRRFGCGSAGERGEAAHALEGAAAARGEDQRVRARPPTRGPRARRCSPTSTR